MTFSIVAADPSTGEVGCAVQSKYFAIGAVTPWVRAGVGAVATQAMGVVARNGEQALAALAAQADPSHALERALAADAGPELRQLGAVAADGRAAAYTGASCIEWAGHLIEPGFAVQGNMLANGEVLPAMRRAFMDTDAALPERMLAALEAGQAAGGDRRGQQAAALIVEQLGAAERSREGIDRICDLRVDDHLEPIIELRRLLELLRQRQTERARAEVL
ncbi:MAG TPA: DUF1028 domain-containing protein [Gaiellaceae bacterium]|nr:DUF1028 domain-containing protein [Gaiellaceae bacterium]